jgi:hypothetical protein
MIIMPEQVAVTNEAAKLKDLFGLEIKISARSQFFFFV